MNSLKIQLSRSCRNSTSTNSMPKLAIIGSASSAALASTVCLWLRSAIAGPKTRKAGTKGPLFEEIEKCTSRLLPHGASKSKETPGRRSGVPRRVSLNLSVRLAPGSARGERPVFGYKQPHDARRGCADELRRGQGPQRRHRHPLDTPGGGAGRQAGRIAGGLQ